MPFPIFHLTILTWIGVRVFAVDQDYSATDVREFIVPLSANTSTPFVIKQSIGENWKVGCERDRMPPAYTKWTNLKTGSYVDGCTYVDGILSPNARNVCMGGELIYRPSPSERPSSVIMWLNFRPFTNRDIGEYQCANEFGESMSVTVRIEALMFRLAPRSITVESGGMAVFICRVMSIYNGTAIIWKRNGQNVITSDDEFTTISWNDLGYSTLTINRIQIEDDQSNISCSAKNGDAGGGETETTDSARLTVLASSAIPRGFPMIDSSGPREIRVQRGRVARIPCETHDRLQDVQWLRDSIPLNLSESRYYEGTDDALFIRHAQLVDQGTYECEVTNSYGTAYSPPIALLLEVSDAADPVTTVALIEVLNSSGSITNETNNRSEDSSSSSPSLLVDIGNQTSITQNPCRFEPLSIGIITTLAIVIVGLLASVIYYRRKKESVKKNRVRSTSSIKCNNAALNYVSNPCYEESSSIPSDQVLHRSV